MKLINSTGVANVSMNVAEFRQMSANSEALVLGCTIFAFDTAENGPSQGRPPAPLTSPPPPRKAAREHLRAGIARRRARRGGARSRGCGDHLRAAPSPGRPAKNDFGVTFYWSYQQITKF